MAMSISARHPRATTSMATMVVFFAQAVLLASALRPLSGAPELAPIYAPEVAPMGSPVDAPEIAPIELPVYAPVMAPVESPIYYAPEMAPVESPAYIYAPEMAPVESPIYAPEMAPPAYTPEASPVDDPMYAPGAPVQAPGVSPSSTSGAAKNVASLGGVVVAGLAAFTIPF